MLLILINIVNIDREQCNPEACFKFWNTVKHLRWSFFAEIHYSLFSPKPENVLSQNIFVY